jgi:hypothetical protein
VGDPALDRKIAFLESTLSGADHSSGVAFIAHLRGVHDLLERWGGRPALCDAGLFHSVYGTQYERVSRTPQREAVQKEIGEEAEALAWLWCFTDRHSLAPNLARDGDRLVTHRDGSERVAITRQQLEDLANLWAADAVEQSARRSDEEMVFARDLASLRSLLCSAADEALDAIAARLPGE